MKTICLKTNNSASINYLLKSLQESNLKDIRFSCHKFKMYTNIFIHYKGNELNLFISEISNILVFLILELYEEKIIKKILKYEYFYFNTFEENTILDKLKSNQTDGFR